MAKKHEQNGRAATLSGDLSAQGPSLDGSAGGARRSGFVSHDDEEREKFVQSLQRRGQAAQGLQKDLLTDVPLLYGSPGNLESQGDPGILLARIHREELVRRNGGEIASSSVGEAPAALPFERAMVWLAVLLVVVLFFAS